MGFSPPDTPEDDEIQSKLFGIKEDIPALHLNEAGYLGLPKPLEADMRDTWM